MSKQKDIFSRNLFQPGGTPMPVRIVVFILFGGVGASLLGSVAATVLNFLFHGLTMVMKLSAQADAFRQDNPSIVLPFALLGAILGGYVAGRVLRGFEQLIGRWDQMEQGDKVTFFLGIFAGLIASIPLLQLFQALEISNQSRIVIIPSVVLGFAALSVYALQSMAEVLPWNRGRGRNKRTGIKILDTNVIIDGRIYDVAKAGFLEGQIYVPGFVLEELQYIADSHDALRRQRGRRGLEILRHMQADFPLEIRVYDKYAPDTEEPVDARLVRLAKAIGGDLVTNDSNLNSVARLQDVRILSLNELALTLRPNVLPQETLELAIIREGNQIGQGVGYLDDGTMVVVENGKNHIGETAEVLVTQVIQTERGKMIFGEIDDESESRLDVRNRRPVRRTQV